MATEILSVTSNNRKSIFIACSHEAIEVARAVKSNFNDEADVDIWNENTFALSRSYLSSLLNRSSFYDYALIIFSPDDKVTIDGNEHFTPRDNTLFELGLFMGRIGVERAFIIAEENVKILSDFAGINISKYRTRGNLVTAVGNACSEIRREMNVSERLYRFSLLPSTSLAMGYYENFIKKVLYAFDTMEKYQVYQKNEMNEKINIQERHIKNRIPKITILLPEKLSDLKLSSYNRIARNLTKIVIDSKAREYPFYLEGDIYDEDNLNFFDIPTTLLASLETINKVFDEDFLVRESIRESIERREISNFEKTLRKLIEDKVEDKTIKFDILKVHR